MPEGPSLRHWCSMAQQFEGRQITRIAGSSKSVEKAKWSGAFLSQVRVYGKQLYLHIQHRDGRENPGTSSDLPGGGGEIWLRCHFLMWGSVRVNEFNCKPSKTNRFPEPRLVFYFSQTEFLVFYGGSYREVDHPPDSSAADILNDGFNVVRAIDNILADRPICFTLLNQAMFPGVGNIIKNEVLFDMGVHPMTLGTDLSRDKASEIVHHLMAFSRRWLAWKKQEKHSMKFGDWTKIYKKSSCPLHHQTTKSLFGPEGMERITYWCPVCQLQPTHEGATVSQQCRSASTPTESNPTSEDLRQCNHSEKMEVESQEESATAASESTNSGRKGQADSSKWSTDDLGTKGDVLADDGPNTKCHLTEQHALGVNACFTNGTKRSAHQENREGTSTAFNFTEASHELHRCQKRIKIEATDDSNGFPSTSPDGNVSVDVEREENLSSACDERQHLGEKAVNDPVPSSSGADESMRIGLSMSTIQLLMKKRLRVNLLR